MLNFFTRPLTETEVVPHRNPSDQERLDEINARCHGADERLRRSTEAVARNAAERIHLLAAQERDARERNDAYKSRADLMIELKLIR